MSARSSTLAVPKELEDALRGARLWQAFESLPLSHRREHATYVAEAKKPETRERRAQRSIGMIEGGIVDTSSKPVIVRLDEPA